MSESPTPDTTQLLRHTLATLAYRANRVLADAPEGFGDFDAGQGVMTPRKMVNHMSMILAYAKSRLTGEEFQRPTEVDDWSMEVDRFYETVSALDKAAEAGFRADGEMVLRMLQGPILDALTHVGQLSLLRRLAGSPTPKDNYIKAQIELGKTGKDQAPAAS